LPANPHRGTDGVQPFLDAGRRRGKGIFVLVRTSNPSAVELQRLALAGGGTAATVAEQVADLVVRWNEGMPTHDGYGPVGAVVGATVPEEARALRRRMPGVVFLVPGY